MNDNNLYDVESKHESHTSTWKTFATCMLIMFVAWMGYTSFNVVLQHYSLVPALLAPSAGYALLVWLYFMFTHKQHS